MSLLNLTLLSVLVLFHVTICRSSQTAATANDAPGKVIGNFKLIATTKANNEIPVSKYRSMKSELTVVIADVEGPTVAGYFALATEAHDDDGLPHTLEHLLFLGSEDYPYKGVLDLLANRCLAAGTNAWTANDHTAYTITTAGSEGFLAMLPIYCDHILYPTLTDSGFLTEVYHVTGEGQDAGVVYSEMEGRENSSYSIVNRVLMRALYPGKCGYKSETGGILENLRKSTTNAKVKAYHKQFYRPENLTLIIAGKVTAEEVFKALEKVEKKIETKGPRDPAKFPKPFKDICPPIKKSEVLEAHFPSETEDNGMVSIAWRGPPTTANYETFLAIQILLKYLTDTSVSPLNKNFVDIPEPLASGASYSTVENNDAYYGIDFSSVPVAKISEIKPKLDTILSDIAKAPEKFDLKRIKTLIHKLRLSLYSSLENNPGGTIASILITDMLYGNSDPDFDKRLNVAKIYETLMTKDSAFWINLLKKQLIETPSVTVKGIPSIQAQKKLEEEDKARVDERVKTLGKEGLAQKQKALDDAVAKNDKEPPAGMLTSIPVPSVNSMKYHQIKHYTSETAEQHPKFNAKEAPFYMLVDHVRTNFVYMYVIMDTSKLTQAERLYLPLLLDLILESPIKRNGKEISYEAVVAELEQDTMSSGAYLGFGSSTFSCGSYCQTAMFMVMVEQDKFEKGIQWLHEGLYQTVFNQERIKTMTNRFINDIPSYERSESTILSELVNGMYYNENSNHYAVSVLRQKKFLNNLLKRINNKQDAPKVITEITQVLKKISSADNIMVHIACDLDELAAKSKDLPTAWNKLLPSGAKTTKKKIQPVADHKVMKQKNTEIMSCIVGMGSATSAYYYQIVDGINDFKSSELAPLQVYENYLTQMEGPMWKNIRGKGLTYNYGLFDVPSEALIYLRFSRATNLIGSYNEAMKLLKQSLTGKYDKTLFESAKSSLLYGIISSESTVGGCIVTAQMSFFRNVPHDHNRKFVKLVSDVKMEDLKTVATKYINPLVDLKKSNIAVVSPPGKINEIAAAFEKYGEKLQIYKTIQESFLNK